jgi:hypothetical protein
MRDYTPDRWKVLRFDYNGTVIDKVFAGWGGSYTHGASWKLSSGITETKEFEDRYEFLNHSGSTYICRKNSEGMTGYQMQVFAGFTKQIEESNGEAKMEVIDYEKQPEQ